MSSELLETADADAHYSEQLVRLPLLGTYFERPVVSLLSGMALATGWQSEPAASAVPLTEERKAERHSYLCPQTLFKFHPDFDEVLAGILSADPLAEIVLLEGRVEHWTNQLQQRFEKTLPGGTRRVRFLPALPRDEFLNLLADADVVLDPLHFGGGHTSYEALAVGTPVVTLPGEYLRSRITQALYRKMGFMELIVATPQQYIAMAVHLGIDSAERRRISNRILETCPVLFNDLREVTGLNNWLWSLTLKSEI